MKLFRSFLFLTLALGATASAAQAEPRTARIMIGDLDFERASDLRLFERRSQSAKESVCGTYVLVRYEEEKEIDACRVDVALQIEDQMQKRTPRTSGIKISR